MVKEIKKGKRYRVVDDNLNFFNPGDVVVALEDGPAPYCVLESAYIDGMGLQNYDIESFWALMHSELEEIKEGE